METLHTMLISNREKINVGFLNTHPDEKAEQCYQDRRSFSLHFVAGGKAGYIPWW